MSIDAIEGPIGSGKTMHVVANFLIPAVQQRRKIFTNIEGLNPREISLVSGVPMCEIRIEIVESKHAWEKMLKLDEVDREYINVQQLKNSTCIIDEAQLIWFTREYKNMSKEFFYFLTKSRHIDCDLVFITQHIENLDVAIRRLGNYFWRVSSKKVFGFLWRLTGQYVVSLRLEADPKAPTFTSKSHRYDEKYFRCYQSAQSTEFQLKRSFSVPPIFLQLTVMIVVGLIGLSRGCKAYRRIVKPPPAAPAVVTPLQADSPHDLGIPRPSSAPVFGVPLVPQELPKKCEKKRVGGCMEIGGERVCKYDWTCR